MDDVGAAAAASKTIRYPRELIRQWIARDRKRHQVGEIASLSLKPDSASFGHDIIEDVERRAAELKADVVVVGFRKTRWLHLGSGRLRLERHWQEVKPRRLKLGGKWFDPYEHFAEWLEAEKTIRQKLASEADMALRRLAAEVGPESRPRYRMIADRLVREDIRTVRGKPWTEDNVRKALGNIEGLDIDRG